MDCIQKPFITKNRIAAVYFMQCLIMLVLSSCLCMEPIELVGIAALAGYWAGFAIGAYRRRQKATLTDVLYIWLGTPVLVICAFQIIAPVTALKRALWGL